ncbi:hypothetical protein ACLK2H_04620 [Escherichia coli]
MTMDDLAFNQRHIWHPYTSMTAPLPVYPILPPKVASCSSPAASVWLTVCHPGGQPFIATITASERGDEGAD